jgi:hypothetical protein
VRTIGTATATAATTVTEIATTAITATTWKYHTNLASIIPREEKYPKQPNN